MSGSHITQPRDRKSQRYLDTHAQLRRELSQLPEPSKSERKRAASREFRATGG